MSNQYGSPYLHKSEFPDHHDPHRCGTAPFVPDVSGERQHSCGSYAAHFDENGCNKYRPNYPDDLYLEKHGCEGLGDCFDGVPPGQPRKYPDKQIWSAEGMHLPELAGNGCDSGECSGPPSAVPSVPSVPSYQSVETFGGSSGCLNNMFTGLLWILLLYVLFQCIKGRRR